MQDILSFPLYHGLALSREEAGDIYCVAIEWVGRQAPDASGDKKSGYRLLDKVTNITHALRQRHGDAGRDKGQKPIPDMTSGEVYTLLQAIDESHYVGSVLPSVVRPGIEPLSERLDLYARALRQREVGDSANDTIGARAEQDDSLVPRASLRLVDGHRSH